MNVKHGLFFRSAFLLLVICAAFLLLSWRSHVSFVAGAAPPAIVYLNGSPAGTLDNLAPLGQKLKRILDQRIRSRAPSSSFRVFVKIDRALPASALIDLDGTIVDSGGESYLSIPDSDASGKNQPAAKLDPSILVVSTDSKATLNPGPITFPFTGSVTGDAKGLKLARVTMSGLEVDDNGQYLINQRGEGYGQDLSPKANSNFGGNRTLDSFTVRQHPVKSADLENAVLGLIQTRQAEIASDESEHKKLAEISGVKWVPEEPGPVEMPIIIGEKTTYGDLMPILNAAAGKPVSFTILVRRET